MKRIASFHSELNQLICLPVDYSISGEADSRLALSDAVSRHPFSAHTATDSFAS